jgi:hypothetical protein
LFAGNQDEPTESSTYCKETLNETVDNQRTHPFQQKENPKALATTNEAD